VNEVFGEFRLLKKLGAGGMGEVFLAQKASAAPVVLKRMLKQHLASLEFRQQFLSEVSAVAQVANRHVVKVYEMGEHNGALFFTMEHLNGLDLKSLLCFGVIPLDVSATILDDILNGLCALHEATDASGKTLGLLHRDLSPANILVCRDGKTKLIDFGLARPASKTSDGTSFAGTAAYLAPELVAGDAFTARSELFALGSIAFEMWHQEKLFDADSDLEILNAILEARLKPFRRDCPTGLETWARQLLEKEPEARPMSARATWQSLQQLTSPSHAGVAKWVAQFLPVSDVAEASPAAHDLPMKNAATKTTGTAHADTQQQMDWLTVLRTLPPRFSVETAQAHLSLDEFATLDALTELCECGALESRELNGVMVFNIASTHAT
jgi:serine/threonine protein kinase